MRLCSVDDLQDGMILGKSIYQGSSNLLLGAGHRISGEIRDKLRDRGYSHVYVMEEGTDDIIPEDIISDEVRYHANAKLSDTVGNIQNAFQFQKLSCSKAKNLLETGYLKNFKISYGLRRIIDEILREIADTGAQFMNSMMLKSRDSYFYDHAVNTTVHAIIIGHQYKFGSSELKNLALGTFLHDIGKIVIEQLDESGHDKNPEELYREHSTFGYLLLRNDNNISPMVSHIVNQHHEYQDGSGYPIGLKGNSLPPVASDRKQMPGYIFRLAEICCVVNAYDNLVMNPRDNTQLAPHQVIRELIVQAGSKYNEHIVQTLSRIIAIFPVGAFVRIVNIIRIANSIVI